MLLKRSAPWFVLLAGFSLAAFPLFGEEAAKPGGRGGQRGEGAPRAGLFAGAPAEMTKTFLLRSEQVQKELKLTEEQTKKLAALQEEQAQKMRELVQGMGGLSPEERRARMQESQKKRAELAQAYDKKLAEVLNADQAKRLDQIALQQRGIRGMLDEEVAKKLGLTDEQKEKITAAANWVREEQTRSLREGREGGARPDPEAFAKLREKRAGIAKEGMNKALAVLTDEQKKKWEEMTGKPFELDMRTFGPGTRPGAGPGAAPGGQGGRRGQGPGGRRGGGGGEGGGTQPKHIPPRNRTR